MTAKRRDGNEPGLNAWIREHPRLGSWPSQEALCVIDVDFVIHRYIVKDKSTGHVLNRQHLMLIEAKAHGASPPEHQRDTLKVLHQLFRAIDRIYVQTLKRGRKRLFYWGLHYLQMSGALPSNSAWMRWDGKAITVDELVEVLRFERNAYTLKMREDRSHHKADPPLNDEWLKPPTTEVVPARGTRLCGATGSEP
jgi:hypothetical protein